MLIHRDIPGLRAALGQWRARGARILLVPTMGALHDGHLSLVTAALSHAVTRGRTLALVDSEDLPIAYLLGGAMRVRLQVVGELASMP